MRGTGEYAALLRHRFHLACTRLGLNETHGSLATDLFRPPVRKGDQLALFE